MRIRTTVGAVAAAVALAGALAACGGESGMGTEGTGAGASAEASAGAAPGDGSEGADTAEGAGAQGGAAGLQATIDGLLETAPISFTPESAELSAESKESLRKIAEAATKEGSSKLEIVTHAGYEDAERSMTLSQERLDAVLAELTAAGLPEDRVQGAAKGNENMLDQEAGTILAVEITVAGA